MARLKSLVTQVKIDRAQRAHNCQANMRHRIKAGDIRLNVKKGRSWDRYCISCAQAILDGDLKKLTDLKEKLEIQSES